MNAELRTFFMSSVIQVENISKAYQIGEFTTGTLSQDIERWWLRMRGKEDRFLMIGEENDRTVTGEGNIVWSLKDINFEIKQGEAIGIIGRNGAGKSTLLKILSRVTTPTTGSVKVKGRIASLLEVGTGFHPELTGRENIFLNGAILGMRKQEIKRKFDEIVSFSGVERYIDTPVKRYSSGMYVRLAFAVAAHLESEILIIDEVLAVGDGEFQKKCLGKMDAVSKGEGRTIIFVSHNMAAIKNLCKDVIILNQGKLYFNGDTGKGIRSYLDNQAGTGMVHYTNTNLQTVSGFEEIKIENIHGAVTNEFAFDEEIFVFMKVKVDEAHFSSRIAIRFVDNMERIVFTIEKAVKELINKQGKVYVRIKIPSKLLVPNKYMLTCVLHIPNSQLFEGLKDIVSFEILETGTDFYLHNGTDYGCVFINCEWSKLTSVESANTL